MKTGLEYADIVKMSEEELELLTGAKEIERGADSLLSKGIKNIFVTMGKAGAYYCNEEEKGFVKSFKVNAVDTTGCGDAFTGAILYRTCYAKSEPLRDTVRFANAAGALCATKRGGIPAMPAKVDVLRLSKKGS